MSGVGLTGAIVPLNGGAFTVFAGNIVANLAALALLAGCSTGTQCFVADQGEYYVLDSANAFALSSPLIVAASGGGRWFRRSKAYVVGNFVLWTCGPNTSDTANLIAGFTPGQLTASGAVVPDIVLQATGALNTADAWDLCPDLYGNLWVVEGDFPDKMICKIALRDALQTANVAASVAVTVASTSGTFTGVSFDKQNNLWISGGASFNNLQKVPQAQYAATGATVSPVILVPTGGAGGAFQQIRFDHQGNLWFASDGSIRQLAAAQLLASNAALAPTTDWHGSNFAAANGFAFGPDGNIWYVNYVAGAGSLHAISPATASGNPASAITITSTSFVGANACCFDGAGNLWVLCADNQTYLRFDASQLTSSGAKVPTVVLTTTIFRAGFPANLTFPNNVDRSGLVASGAPVIP